MNAEARIEPMSIDHWQSHGWMTVPGFLGPDELDLLRNEADRLLQEKRHFDMRGGVPFSPTRSDRLDPVIDLSPSFAALAADPRVTGLAATVLGGQPQLMKDKFIAKPPGAAVQEDGRLGAGRAGALPIDAVSIADIEMAGGIGFDFGIEGAAFVGHELIDCLI